MVLDSNLLYNRVHTQVCLVIKLINLGLKNSALYGNQLGRNLENTNLAWMNLVLEQICIFPWPWRSKNLYTLTSALHCSNWWEKNQLLQPLNCCFCMRFILLVIGMGWEGKGIWKNLWKKRDEICLRIWEWNWIELGQNWKGTKEKQRTNWGSRN